MIKFNDNIKILAPKHIDWRYGPWTSVAEAMTNIPVYYRCPGLKIGIVERGVITDYWWASTNLRTSPIILSTGGGGGGGTLDYEALVNKPMINGVELIGNITLPTPIDAYSKTESNDLFATKTELQLVTNDLGNTISNVIQLEIEVAKKVEDANYVHTDNNYTTAEKNKLAALDDNHWKGKFTSLVALETAFPTANDGDYASVDAGAGSDVQSYIWDSSDTKWVIQAGVTTAETPATIKSKYESNPDTNAFTNNEKTKLANIAAGAEVNVQANWNETDTNSDAFIRNKPTIPSTTGLVPYTGSTQNVDLGNYKLLAKAITLPNSAPTTPVPGDLYYDPNELSLVFVGYDGTMQQIGQELYTEVVNKTGAQFNDGWAGYIAGVQGNRPTTGRADSSNLVKCKVIGVATQNIADNAEGKLTTFGIVHGYDTRTVNAGDDLWLNGNDISNVKPTTGYVVHIGYALNSTVNGSIFVMPSRPLAIDLTSNSDEIAPTVKAVKTETDKAVKYENSTATINTTAANTSGAVFSSELLSSSGWTLTSGWTGDFTNGFTHSAGTTTLTNSFTPVIGERYKIVATMTGRTAGTVTYNIGGLNDTIAVSYTYYLTATTTAILTITPTTDFNGNIKLSIMRMETTSNFPYLTTKSGSTILNEIRTNSTGESIGIGKDANHFNDTGVRNTSIGYEAGINNYTGNDNVLLGYRAGKITSNRNNGYTGCVAIGSGAGTGINILGTGVIAIGKDTASVGGANYTTAIGYIAGTKLSTESVAIGTYAAQIATGANLVAIGTNTMINSSGGNNTAIGNASLNSNTSGVSNTALGYFSGAANITGTYNLFLGQNAGRYQADGTTARTTGDYGIYIGSNARASANGLTNEIVIGKDAIGSGSNTITLGNTSNVGVTFNGYLYFNNGTNAGDTVGDRRAKVINGIYQVERCSVANATKGGGTWISDNSKGAFPIVEVTSTGAISQTLTANKIYDIQKKLTGTLTLTIDSSTRMTGFTNDYMVQFDMGALQTVVHPVNTRWAESVTPYITASKMFLCTYTEKIIWTKNLYVLTSGSGQAIVGTAWNTQKHTMSFTPSGAGILTALQAIPTITFSRATTNVTASSTFFVAAHVGLHLFIGSTYAGQIQSITSTTVAVVSGSGTIASAAGSIGGYISSSSTSRQELAFTPYYATTDIVVTVTNGGSVMFEAREFASPYLATNVETAQTIYIGNIETI